MSAFQTAFQELLASDIQLPTLPVLVLEVQRALDNEMSGARDIVRLIERDPALAARLLKAGNSALYSQGQPVNTINAAVSRLGINQVRSICLAVAVVRAFGSAHRSLDHQRFWEHSAAVGLVAEHLGRLSKRHAQVDGGELYVAGLLHDVGLLILDQFFPEQFAATCHQTEEETVPSWQVEDRELGMDHGAIGGLLLERWRLPSGTLAAVSYHHKPEGAPEDARAIAELVWAAEALCTASGLELPQEGTAQVPPTDVFERLGIPPENRDAILAEVGVIGERAKQFSS